LQEETAWRSRRGRTKQLRKQLPCTCTASLPVGGRGSAAAEFPCTCTTMLALALP
jgi:hypothetical protein